MIAALLMLAVFVAMLGYCALEAMREARELRRLERAIGRIAAENARRAYYDGDSVTDLREREERRR